MFTTYSEETTNTEPVIALPSESKESMRDYLAETARKIAADTIEYAQKETAKMIDETRKQLSDLAQAKKIIAHVKINDAAVKDLGQRMSPYVPEIIADLKTARLSGQWPFLVGPAGSGKTTIAKQVAKALDKPLYCLSGNEEISLAWLTGMHTANGFVMADFMRAVTNGGVFLMDEFDRNNANALTFINMALANGEFYNPVSGEMVKVHPEFYFIATGNTMGKGADPIYGTANSLDGSTLDRLFRIEIDYDTDLEDSLCTNEQGKEILWALRENLQRLNSSEVISTRAFINLETKLLTGYTLERFFERFLLGWPKGLLEQTGVTIPKSDAPPKRGRGRPPGSKNKPKEEHPF